MKIENENLDSKLCSFIFTVVLILNSNFKIIEIKEIII